MAHIGGAVNIKVNSDRFQVTENVLRDLSNIPKQNFAEWKKNQKSKNKTKENERVYFHLNIKLKTYLIKLMNQSNIKWLYVWIRIHLLN